MGYTQENCYQGASKQAIQHHYDVSNEFYQLWLDETLSYSCALWEEGESYDALEIAQIRKLDYYINQVKTPKLKRVLEIGCGWGALLRRLVEVHQVETAIGLTLSQAQLDYINSLEIPKITVKLKNWFDFVPNETYDAIISIAAFEAFAKPGLSEAEKIQAYSTFFARCYQLIKPGGLMAFQTIAYGNMRVEELKPLIVNDIFPESDLPRLVEITAAFEPFFEPVVLVNARQDYLRTLKAWLKQLKTQREAAIKIVGEEIVDRYQQYLQHSAFGFASGAQNLFRITLRRIDQSCL